MLHWWVHLSWSQATSVALTVLGILAAVWLFRPAKRRWPKTSSHPSFFSAPNRDLKW